MGNIHKEMETLMNNKKEMLDIKNTITEIKDVFEVFISRLDTVGLLYSLL